MKTALASLVLLLVAALPAHAAGFCVGAPAGCAGTDFTAVELQNALDAAALAPSPPHRVVIAPGTYTGPFTSSGPAAIEIVGAGVGQTILTNDPGTPGTAALLMGGSALKSVHDLTLQSLGNNGYALRLSLGEAHDVALVSAAGSNSALEIGQNALVHHSTVTVADGRGVFGSGSAGRIEDSTITATGGTGTGVVHSGTGGTTTVRRSRIVNFQRAATADSGTIRVEDSVIDMSTRNGAIGVAAINGNNSAALQAAEVVNTTIVGTGPGQVALRAIADGTSTESASLTVTDTVVSITGDTAYQCASTGMLTSASATITNLAMRPATFSTTNCTPTQTGDIDITGTPRFVDEAGGDLRPRFDSPLVDSGSTASPPGATDALGKPRVVNGTVDRGAVEYQRAAPQITLATATPSLLAVGGSVAFAGAATDADGDPVAFAWAFGDGQAGSGAGPSHVYTAGGSFTATLTATDGAGLTATADVGLTVVSTASALTPPSVVTDGSPAFGETLGASAAVWDLTGTITREWLSCDAAGAGCVAIAGATATSFVPGAGVVGRTLRLRETLANLAGTSASTSAATARIVRRPFVVRRPRITGVARAGRLVRCMRSFGGFPVPQLTYRWVRNGRPIARATRQTFRLRPGDVGARIVCRVTARNSAGVVASQSLRIVVRS